MKDEEGLETYQPPARCIITQDIKTLAKCYLCDGVRCPLRLFFPHGVFCVFFLLHAILLGSSVLAASLGQNMGPFDFGWVVSLDADVWVEGLLECLSGSGIDHGPLQDIIVSSDFLVLSVQGGGVRGGPYQDRSLSWDPGDENNLLSV